ncbi:MAG TPA: carbohydrate-binding family 9-like protein [Terriglobales bacterium]|nr:carbohydrate-binding family 9-like protein [Terriglobales bacterium]
MNTKKQHHLAGHEAVAARVKCVETDGFPAVSKWDKATPIRFNTDWQGKNADAARETEVRLLWTPETLFVKFVCGYRELVTFPGADIDGYRYQLWDRDVAELFVQADRFGSRYYKEFEVAPNAYWIDLDIFPEGHQRLHSGLRRRAWVDEDAHVWSAELALPLSTLAAEFDPAKNWRVNFFRCEGSDPNRWYSAWSATNTPQPNFHVPEAFGVLRFEDK